MRIWSLHPRHLDPPGLVACWRETLLAQKVLRGLTTGYRHHPQLLRWQATDNPVASIAAYLHGVADEADARGYRFDRGRICLPPNGIDQIEVTSGQLAYEWEHLLAKLSSRSPERYAAARQEAPTPHPVFREVPGEVAPWEVR
ncbi:pyrimidine dimer DNA glycosylase/endonuclease V [Actinomycetota bacterium]